MLEIMQKDYPTSYEKVKKYNLNDKDINKVYRRLTDKNEPAVEFTAKSSSFLMYLQKNFKNTKNQL